jgi:Zn-dependent M28 family amino/carboxypeptidase
MMRLFFCLVLAGLPVVLSAQAPGATGQLQPALESMSAEGLLRHTRVLAADDFEGRAPGTPGEEKTIRYLEDEFRKLRLKPGNPDGTYIQNVPMVGSTPQAAASATVRNERIDWLLGEECVVWSKRMVSQVKVENAEMVFVGYGAVAPEYGWDDYKGVDVRGKTIVMLINDPQVPDPKDSQELDPQKFKGRAMTYYGRWTYKYEEAARKGAAAAIIIHETELAGYPWEVVQESNSREGFDLARPDKNLGRAAVEGWLHLKPARQLFAACGLDFEALKKAALSPDFKPISLGAKASFTITNTLRNVTSRNVIARLEGSDPRLKDEFVIYTAHWDHLGMNPKLQGDQIFNGALDNASGTAMLLELTKAFTRLNPAPRRSVLFMAPTAEEKGFLGAQYYATHPLWPLERTVANLNIDTINVLGRTRDIAIVGEGNSTLEDTLTAAAAAQNRTLSPESFPQFGMFYRADHFEFCRAGVPALYFSSGTDFVGKPKEFGLQKKMEYISRHYHKTSDEILSDWDLSGAMEDAALLLEVGWRAAQQDDPPRWKPASEFKSRREPRLVP